MRRNTGPERAENDSKCRRGEKEPKRPMGPREKGKDREEKRQGDKQRWIISHAHRVHVPGGWTLIGIWIRSAVSLIPPINYRTFHLPLYTKNKEITKINRERKRRISNMAGAKEKWENKRCSTHGPCGSVILSFYHHSHSVRTSCYLKVFVKPSWQNIDHQARTLVYRIYSTTPLNQLWLPAGIPGTEKR